MTTTGLTETVAEWGAAPAATDPNAAAVRLIPFERALLRYELAYRHALLAARDAHEAVAAAGAAAQRAEAAHPGDRRVVQDAIDRRLREARERAYDAASAELLGRRR